jgi:hypothetical protein
MTNVADRRGDNVFKGDVRSALPEHRARIVKVFIVSSSFTGRAARASTLHSVHSQTSTLNAWPYGDKSFQHYNSTVASSTVSS